MSFSQNITRAALALSVSMLAACGGGGGGSPAAPASQAAPQPKPVQIAAMGDSTMLGLTLVNGQYVATGDTVADMQADLQAQFGPTVTVVNHSVTGTTLGDVLSGHGGVNQTLAQYLASDTTSQIVIENYGINDFALETPQDFQAYLVQFISMVRSANKIVVLEEPNPVCSSATAPQNVPQLNGAGQNIDVYVGIIDAVAKQYDVPLVQQYNQIMNMPNWCALLSDGFAHPTPALYAIKAKNEAAVLAPIVKQLGG